MGYRPPTGVRPPQLEGKRTGRPKGSKSYAKATREVLWAYQHRLANQAEPPTPNAAIWWRFAHMFPYELARFLEEYDLI